MRLQVGPFLVFSDFDSGNVLTAALVENNLTDQTSADSQVSRGHLQPEYELDICTKPDCFGTVYENGNRTWFHFGIQGGKPGTLVKLNILNLNKQVKLFTQGMQPVFRCLPHKPNWERVRDRLIINEKEEHICSISFRQRLPDDASSVLYIAFTYPYSNVELFGWLNTLDRIYNQTKSDGLPFHSMCKLGPVPTRAELLMLKSARSTKNQIYYHRECVCYSLEGRRIELITITSCEGMSDTREDRLSTLFPLAEERPHRFPSKKVIFLSARVHPGETPSSFVLNGIYKFLLEPTDPRALLLRKLFVFKLIPMLNPDGVAHGHYRSDTRGVNLNRVYLEPSRKLHPSIYACRKLLLYYHNGSNFVDETDNLSLSDGAIPPSRSSTGEQLASQIGTTSMEAADSKRIGHYCGQHFISSADRDDTPLNVKKLSPQFVKNESRGIGLQKRATMSEDSSDTTTFEACDEDSLVYISPEKLQESAIEHRTCNTDQQVSTRSSTQFSPRKRKEKEKANFGKQCKRSKSITHMFSTSSISSNSSGLFCYIDMHGHATKRGIFMYGNHFDDPVVQAECMLLPRLMSLNCPNFDFSACNFTERLMNMRDRKDGASREGSGRVAIFKLTGLIRSYTLECNYNTGRLVNNIVSRNSLLGLVDTKKFSSRPPQFTPEIFEEAGRSLAESLLDLAGRNPWSRVGFTEFKTIDGLRRSLLKQIQISRDLEPSDCVVEKVSSATSLRSSKRRTRSAGSISQPMNPGSSKTFKIIPLTVERSRSCSNVQKKEKKQKKLPSCLLETTRSSSSGSLLKSFKVKRKLSTKDSKTS